MNDVVLYVPEVLSILGSVVIGLITSYFTVWLSLRKFRSEKLWEKKIEAYTRIINALYELKKNLYERMEEYYEELNENLTGKEKMVDDVLTKGKFHLYDEELKKYRDIGTLIISAPAVKLINQYHKELSTDEDDIEDRYNIDIRAAEKCLEAILLEAKTDLLT